VGIQHRVAGLGIDDQNVSVTGLEVFGKVNLIVQPGGRVLRQVIRGDRAVRFVEDSNPVVVNWQIGGELQMPGRVQFRGMPSVEVETRHASIG